MVGFGMKIVENIHMVDEVQRKAHRKKRINKKWAKKYGFTYAPKRDVFVTGEMIIGHPITINELTNRYK